MVGDDTLDRNRCRRRVPSIRQDLEANPMHYHQSKVQHDHPLQLLYSLLKSAIVLRVFLVCLIEIVLCVSTSPLVCKISL